jgi:uncharacterized membrane protein
MKETFKKVFNRVILEPIIIFIVTMLTLEFLIYPGLSIDNTLLNILSGALGVFLALVLLSYIDGKIRDRFEKKPFELSEEQQEKIITSIKEKGLYQEPTKPKKPKKDVKL